MRCKLKRYTQASFDPGDVIEAYLVTPARVTTNGLLGRFDTLRVALAHLQTHGAKNTVLSVQGDHEELQFSNEALEALVGTFAVWLCQAPGMSQGIERLDDAG